MNSESASTRVEKVNTSARIGSSLAMTMMFIPSPRPVAESMRMIRSRGANRVRITSRI